MAQDHEEGGYVGAKIDQQEAFDAGAYSFFGDMAPLDEGLGGALEDGLEAPPEEWPAQGELEDEDDLPIEALMDEDDEDEDLSLAALLRRQMLINENEHGASSSSKVEQVTQPPQVPAQPQIGSNGPTSAVSAQQSQQQPALLPPMPPQPALLGHLGHHSPQQQPQHSAPAAVADAQNVVQSSPVPLQRSQPARVDRSVGAAGAMSLADLEAQMLSSASKAAEQQQQLQPGGQLLSMLRGGQPHQSPQMHNTMPPPGHQLAPGPQQAAAGALVPLPAASMPPAGFPGPGGMQSPLPPQGSLGAMASLQQPQPQHGPGMPPEFGGLPPSPMGPPFRPGMPPPHLPPPLPIAGGLMPPPMPGMMGPPHAGMHPGFSPHPGMMPPPPMPGMGPLPFMGPDGMPPRGPPMPGQLAPRGGVPPGFPGPPPHFQQPPPAYVKPQLPDGLAAVPPPPQQLQQQAMTDPQAALQPRQPSPGRAWAPRSAANQLAGQLQQSGAPGQPRHPSPGNSVAPGFGGGYDPLASMQGTASSTGKPGAASESGAQLVHRLRTSGSELMAADEINYILRIQHMATHGGHPYMEDFYYQAFLNKYYGGRNALIFAPAELRDLSESHEATEPRFADLSGLGKIVISNIRTPKMLMDVSSMQSKGAADNGKDAIEHLQGSEGKTRPLEQEPMLAARIMIEDCMLLLSDVEDIDRMFAAAAAAATAPAGAQVPSISPSQAQTLLHRRAALLDGIAASFRLPDTPVLHAAADGTAGGDGVFVRLIRLPKGRALVSKTLRLMFSVPSLAGAKTAGADAALQDSKSKGIATGLDVIWAVLRNADQTYSPAVAASAGGEAERRMLDATVALSAAAGEMVKRLTKPEEAASCLVAALAGLEAASKQSGQQLLPLFPAGRVAEDASPDWLGSVLASLLLRASELGLGSFAAAGTIRTLGEGYKKGEAEKAAEEELMLEAQATAGAAAEVAGDWQVLLGRFTELVMLHLWGLMQAVRSGGMVAAGSVGVELKPFVHKLTCVPLIRVLMAHCGEQHKEQLRSYLSSLQ